MKLILLIFNISLMLLEYYLLLPFQRTVTETKRLLFFSHISLYLFLLLPLCSSPLPHSRIIQYCMWCNESVGTVNVGLGVCMQPDNPPATSPHCSLCSNPHQCSVKEWKLDFIHTLRSFTPEHAHRHTNTHNFVYYHCMVSSIMALCLSCAQLHTLFILWCFMLPYMHWFRITQTKKQTLKNACIQSYTCDQITTYIVRTDEYKQKSKSSRSTSMYKGN